MISGSIERGMSNSASSSSSHSQGLEVHQHGAAGVGDVGDVHAAVAAAGHVPQQPACRCCRRCASPFSAASRTPSTFSRIHWILPPEKYVAGGRPALRPDHVAVAVALERAGDAVGAGVLPDDRVVVRPPGVAVPHHRRLALVGDAERGEVGRPAATPCSARSASTDVERSQISTGLCSTQPACGRICSCSSWCLATSLPSWSKIMNRVLVVPWSIAPTKSGMVSIPHGSAPRDQCVGRERVTPNG